MADTANHIGHFWFFLFHMKQGEFAMDAAQLNADGVVNIFVLYMVLPVRAEYLLLLTEIIKAVFTCYKKKTAA